MMTEDIAKSTAYDARLQYLEVLGAHLKTKAYAAHSNDYKNYEKSLRQMLYMLTPFIKPSKLDPLMDQIDRARKLIKRNDSRFSPWIEDHLDYVDSRLYATAIHVLMPASTDEAQEEIDWEQWMKDSDL